MSVLDDIRAGVQAVIANGVLAEAVSHYARTSSTATSPATFAVAATIYGLITGVREVTEMEEETDKLVRKETCSFRTVTTLKDGDQIHENGRRWHVAGQQSEAAGVIRYELTREIPRRGAGRKGQV